MRITSEKALHEFWQSHGDAETSLRGWIKVARRAQWRNMAETRRDWSSADETRDTASGKPITIFNIGGNKYRLITAIHYDRQRIFTLTILTHAEYSKERWKESL